jgi:hypothetical protein
MPKIAVHGGPTSEGEPGYFEPGRSHQSPNVLVTEEQYADAMSRHGTDDWTERDQRVQEAWLAQGNKPAVAPEVKPTAPRRSR